MIKEAISTEQQIKNAAEKVFLQKGFDGATTRDIALEAGINRALVNYYFRSKEKLFEAILKEKSDLYFQENVSILQKPIGIIEKIKEIMDYDFEKYLKMPELTFFIHNELHRKKSSLVCVPLETIKQFQTLFNAQIIEAIDRQEIRPIDPNHLLALLSASVKHHFASKPLITRLYHLENEQFNQFLLAQKELTFEMIKCYLRPSKE